MKFGSPTVAQLAYAEMHNAVGAAEAHMRSGGSVYIPTTSIQEASHDFTMSCVREAPASLAGSRRRRRK